MTISEYITIKYVSSLLESRDIDAHKHKYGHALLICGSYDMPGAALLAVGGALRSGCGLVSAHICDGIRSALIANYPSAMLSINEGHYFSELPKNIEKYNAIGFGCGLGHTNSATIDVVSKLLITCKQHDIPMVIDADGLNIIAEHKEMLHNLPGKTVMTPHHGELKRLIDAWENEEEMLERTARFSATWGVVMVIKGRNSTIITPQGQRFVNTTGNAGMAKGGCGDVLTGLITGLIARGYDVVRATQIGVWLHGFAGDKASDCLGQEAMNSSDVIDFLADGFMELE